MRGLGGHGRALGAAWLLALLGAGNHAWAAAPVLHLVPAGDVALATMVLVARGAKEPVLLVDPRDRAAVEHFRKGWRGKVRCLTTPSTSRGTVALLRELAKGDCTEVDDLRSLARSLWPETSTAIGADPADYAGWLRAAAFAGATGSILVPLGQEPQPDDSTLFEGWRLGALYLSPSAAAWRESLLDRIPKVVQLPTPDAMMEEWLQLVSEAPHALVVANQADRDGIFSPSSLSLLAPLVATMHRVPLFLTGSAEADVVETEVLSFIDRHELAVSHVILVGDELGLRSHRVPDPVLAAGGPEARGGGTVVRVELFSEIERQQPQDLVVGRIVAEDATHASVLLARQQRRAAAKSRPSIVFFSNADSIFRLGEAISRTTVAELRNVGVPVRAYYGDQIDQALVHRSLESSDVLVWEGHARDLTLEERGGIAAADAPDVVFLQGCYTFDRSDPFILMEKGSFAIVGTSTAIYSAPGSALARAFFDAILYEGADLGTATRNARNFLLALSRLQRQRGHRDWRKTYRAALAFSLWGDPTITLGLRPASPKVTPVRWDLRDATLALTIPRRTLQAVTVGPYRAQPQPRAMLGGLLLREGDDEKRRLKELYFTVRDSNHEVMACAPVGRGWDVVSLYAPRSHTLTVLARPDWTLITPPPKGEPFVFPVVPEKEGCPAAGDPAAGDPATGDPSSGDPS